MVNIFAEAKKAKGIKLLLGEPFIFIWYAVILTFLSITFSQTIGVIMTSMLVIGGVIFYLLKSQRAFGFGLNSLSGNTIQSLLFSLLFLGVFLALSAVWIGAASGFQTVESTGDLLTENSAAFLGASKLVLEGNPLLTFIVFVFIIAPIETYFIIQLQLFILFARRRSINLNKLISTPEFYVWNFVLALGAVWFHLQAKGVASFIPLSLVFLFFFITLIIPHLKFVSKKPEAETAIWMHIINNGIATLKSLRFI